MKIHIIGCSGTGKTYFTNKLSNKYNIPHFDLDNIQWTNKYQSKNLKEINKILERYENKVVWITSSQEIDRILSD